MSLDTPVDQDNLAETAGEDCVRLCSSGSDLESRIPSEPRLQRLIEASLLSLAPGDASRQAFLRKRWRRARR